MKKIITLLLIAAFALTCFVSCVKDGEYDTSKTGYGTDIDMTKVAKEIDSYKFEDFEAADGETDYVAFKIKNYGNIVVALRSDVAPITVENFKKLVKEGFYTDLIFHRVIKGFMIQGGGMYSGLKDKESDEIKGEFTSNGVENNLRHIRGVLSMARTTIPDSASSQFFVMHADWPSLDGQYAAFGYVLAGMDVVDEIANCTTTSVDLGYYSMDDVPAEDIVIEEAFFVKPIKK